MTRVLASILCVGVFAWLTPSLAAAGNSGRDPDRRGSCGDHHDHDGDDDDDHGGGGGGHGGSSCCDPVLEIRVTDFFADGPFPPAMARVFVGTDLVRPDASGLVRVPLRKGRHWIVDHANLESVTRYLPKGVLVLVRKGGGNAWLGVHGYRSRGRVFMHVNARLVGGTIKFTHNWMHDPFERQGNGHAVPGNPGDDEFWTTENTITFDSTVTTRADFLHFKATCRGQSCGDACAGVVCPGATACEAASQCDPTTGLCVPGAAVPDGTACDDGDVCNGIETCQARRCSAGTAPALDDGNPCTVDACDPVAGVTHANAPEGSACNDNNACTSDACSEGACVGTSLCHANATCAPTGCACNDGYTGDGQSCAPTPRACDPHDLTTSTTLPTPITAAACESVLLSDVCPAWENNVHGCVNFDRTYWAPSIDVDGVTYPHGLSTHAPNTGESANATCRFHRAGVDTGGRGQAAWDLGGRFDVFEARIALSNGEYNSNGVAFRAYLDGVPIYDSGVILFSTPPIDLRLGVAGGQELVLDVDANGDYFADHAAWLNARVRASCPDACGPGNNCSGNGACVRGVCECDANHSGAYCETTLNRCLGVTCAAGDACNEASACDPATGACLPRAPKANGTSCADADACDGAETCQSGTCTAGTPVTCAPTDRCYIAGSCDPSTGQCSQTRVPSVWDGSYTLTDQASVDALYCIEEITGRLTLSPQSALASIDLPRLKRVGAGVHIVNNASLVSLQLSGLQRIGDVLFIDGNGALTTVDVSSLTQTGSTFYVTRNPELATFGGAGLSALVRVEGTFVLNNTKVATLGPTSLANLTVVAGGLHITDNVNLTALDLRAVPEVGDVLYITGNTSLTTLDLSSLTKTGSSLYVTGSPNLTTYGATGLSALTWVGGNLVLNNTKVTTLGPTSLANLTHVGSGLHITDHVNLVNLDLHAVPELGDVLYITGNTALTTLDLSSLTRTGSSMYVNGSPMLNTFGAKGLSALTSVGGNLVLQNTKVTTLGPTSLANLTHVGSGLHITDHVNLVNLDLHAVPELGDVLYITGNTALTTLDLSSLTRTGSSMYVNGSPMLNTFGAKGLSALTSVGGNLVLQNTKVTTLGPTSLANLTHVGVNLHITDHVNLVNLDLHAVPEVGDVLFITGNTSLTTLDLSSLTKTGSSMTVNGSPQLATFGATGLSRLATVGDNLVLQSSQAARFGATGLSSLTRVGGGFHINYHPSLLALGTVALTHVGDIVSISGNYKLSECETNALRTLLQANNFTNGFYVSDVVQCDPCIGVVCTALDACHDIGTCNSTTGICSNPVKASGTSCSDDNACTQNDQCQSGTCVVGANPCVNGGQCAGNGSIYICTCVGGFTGQRCETPPTANDGNGFFPPPPPVPTGVPEVLASGFSGPVGIAIDQRGVLFITDYNLGTISTVDPRVTPAAVAVFASGLSGPAGLILDLDGSLSGSIVVAERDLNRVSRVYVANGVAGAPQEIVGGIHGAAGVLREATGHLLVSAEFGNKVYRVTQPTVTLSAVIESGLNGPTFMKLDRDGNLYLGDYFGTVVHKYGPELNSLADLAGYDNPCGIAIDAEGGLYIANRGDGTISKTVGGVPSPFVTGLVIPQDMAFDASGTLYVVNYGGGQGVVSFVR